MRALTTEGKNSPWLLAEVPPPDIGPQEVLVEVAAAGLNRADLLMRQGDYVPTSADWNVPLNRVGFEMAGRVRAFGPEVSPESSGFTAGQWVMAQTGGACAEWVAVDHRYLLPVPPVQPVQPVPERAGTADGRRMAEAAGLPSALLTEYDALTEVGLIRRGDRVLITGATSGVGLIGVQLAHALGAASVMTTTRSPAKAALLRTLGADRVIDTSTTGITAALGADAYDLCLDHLGGPFLPDLMGAAAPRARIVQIGRLAGDEARLDLELLAARRLRLTGTTFRGRTAEELHTLVARLRSALPDLLSRHEIRPVLDSVHDLTAANEAAARLTQPDLTGKVILRVGRRQPAGPVEPRPLSSGPE